MSKIYTPSLISPPSVGGYTKYDSNLADWAFETVGEAMETSYLWIDTPYEQVNEEKYDQGKGSEDVSEDHLWQSSPYPDFWSSSSTLEDLDSLPSLLPTKQVE